MGSWILSFKVFLISIGLVSFALGIKFSTSFIVQFPFNQASVIWSIVVSFLQPPYLYFTVNVIIITIIASLRNHIVKSEPLVLVDQAPPPVQSEIKTIVETPLLAYDIEDEIVEVKPVLINGAKVDFDPNEEETGDIDTDYEPDGGDEFDILSSAYTPPQKIIPRKVQSKFLLPEKPLVCSEFSHRNPNRANPEEVRANLEGCETLESTWKMITEGHQVTPTKHFKKSDTLKELDHHVTTSSSYRMSKSKTFIDPIDCEGRLEAASNLSSSTRITKELSPGRDELNRQVEAFIQKFKEETRLQKQESLNKCTKMINRGAYN